eukprot:CAMPEP_0119009984 /NCGR_PEP_ID=MMETSP1176-20130426/4716_1 /TAXON_ID=265551 /ORGANISM="Synedropsis recta cf, Strain CCMP1620" /LENGTH=207 /DNA_ID=CAMNT_0006962569 /DNA_START=306 /DNA_END=925 /DNA_ORIENTATION=-
MARALAPIVASVGGGISTVDPQCPTYDANGDTDSTDFHRLSDFCIRSNTPSGEFIMPMVRNIIYNDLDSCIAGIGGYVELVAAHPQFCQTTPVNVDNQTVLVQGSMAYCQEGKSTAKRFSDRSCSTQDPLLDILSMEFGSKNECVLLEDWLGGFYATMDCSSPTIHCKDLSTVTDWIIRMDESAATTRSSSAIAVAFYSTMILASSF